MAAIKKFFEKKKVEAKFKLAGRGHKLNESPSISPRASSSSSDTDVRYARPQTAESTQRAGAAALARFEQHQQQEPTMANRSLQVIRAEALKQLEAEQRKAELGGTQKPSGPREIVQDSAPVLAVSGVYFRCPLIGPDVLPREEMKHRIREFLYQQLEDERGLTSCLILHTCNRNKEKVNFCIQTLCKYLDNLIQDPTEEKYRRIRVQNRIFQERVAGLDGVQDFLLAAGFELQMLSPSEGAPPEEFYVFSDEKMEHIDSLTVLRDALVTAEPIVPELDRCVKVLVPTQAAVGISLPPEFYTVTAEELKKEQQLRAEAVERNAILRTKAMRERDEIRELRRYRYSLIRVRFPDGILLQGTFYVGETLLAVRDFITEHLECDYLPFVLSVLGQRLESHESTLLEIKLVPAAMINFTWDSAVTPADAPARYLKAETLALLQSL